jgi:hypothetical protein
MNTHPIDKIFWTSVDVDIARLRGFFGETIVTLPHDKSYLAHYRSCDVVRDMSGKHLYTIKYGPKRSNMFPYSLEHNPAKQDLNLISMEQWLSPCMSVTDSLIKRIDYKTDYITSRHEAFKTFIFKGKGACRAYLEEATGGLSGFYAGARGEQLVVYAKTFEFDGKKFKRKNNIYVPDNNLTRFELRQEGTGVEFSRLSDLKNLASFNPFGGVTFLTPKHDCRERLEELGFNSYLTTHNFYKANNRNGHWDERFAHYFTTSDLGNILSDKYKQEIPGFLTGSLKT